MDGSNKDVGLDNINAGAGTNKVDFGDVYSAGDSNLDDGVDNEGGVVTNDVDDANCRDGDHKADCSDNLDGGGFDNNDDGNVDDGGGVDSNAVLMARAKLIALKIWLVMIVIVILMVVPMMMVMVILMMIVAMVMIVMMKVMMVLMDTKVTTMMMMMMMMIVDVVIL